MTHTHHGPRLNRVDPLRQSPKRGRPHAVPEVPAIAEEWQPANALRKRRKPMGHEFISLEILSYRARRQVVLNGDVVRWAASSRVLAKRVAEGVHAPSHSRADDEHWTSKPLRKGLPVSFDSRH